jgi:hypothetical protein
MVASGATYNFVHPRILSAEIPIRRQHDKHVLLAGEGKKMVIAVSYDLHFVVADLSVDTSFLVFPSLRFDHVLDRRWLKKFQVIHDHNLDCLYLGKESRKEYSLAKRRGKNYQATTSLGKMSNTASPQNIKPRLEDCWQDTSTSLMTAGPSGRFASSSTI